MKKRWSMKRETGAVAMIVLDALTASAKTEGVKERETAMIARTLETRHGLKRALCQTLNREA